MKPYLEMLLQPVWVCVGSVSVLPNNLAGGNDSQGASLAAGVFNGVDGNYWATLRFDVTGLISEPEATTTLSNDPLGTNTSPDCILWAASILAVETEPPVFDHFSFFPLISQGDK
jgi:hypothetical protein